MASLWRERETSADVADQVEQIDQVERLRLFDPEMIEGLGDESCYTRSGRLNKTALARRLGRSKRAVSRSMDKLREYAS